MPKPQVLQMPEAGNRLKQGFDTMAQVLTTTLGPTQGTVYVDALVGSKVELLSDAATIARRIIELPGRAEDAGAMLLRHTVWQIHKRVGDGSATTATIAKAILDETTQARAAGFNPMRMRVGIEQATEAALQALSDMAHFISDEEEITTLAEAMTAEPNLSIVLGEIFGLIGPNANVRVENYVAPYLEREYIEGGSWKADLASPYLITDKPTRRAHVNDCYVVLYKDRLERTEDVQPLLELIAQQKEKRIFILVKGALQGDALGMLVANNDKKTVQVVAAALRSYGPKIDTDFDDLALMTGATILAPERGRPLPSVRLEDLGHARRVDALGKEVIVVGDQKHSSAVREQINTLQAQIKLFTEDAEELEELQFRLARLSGQIVNLKIGASTKTERITLSEKAEKSIRALALGLREGVAPGGGVAYLNCIPAVQALKAEDEGEAMGIQILAKALEGPFYQILNNAHIESPTVIRQDIERRGPGHAYDVIEQKIVNVHESGLLDAVGVLRRALKIAVSCAVMAATTDVMVLKRKREEGKVVEP